MNRIKRRIAIAAILGGMTTTAAAQTAYRPSSVRIENGEWNYVPIIEFDSTSSSVHSIVAFSSESTTIGQNLVAVWYVRAGETWAPKSWSEKDRWGIVEQIKDSLVISDDDDNRWGESEPLSGAPVSAPESMVNGVLVTDPLADMLAVLPDPAPIVELLVSIGYDAAVTPTDVSPIGCSSNDMLGQIAIAVMEEGAKEEPDTLVVSQSLVASGMKECAGMAKITPISIRPIGPPTPWGPPRCSMLEAGGCMWLEQCFRTRTQLFVSRRTRTCVVGGVVVYCDQMALLTCSEEDTRLGPALVPGTLDSQGCHPPALTPPMPTGPCGAHGDGVLLIHPVPRATVPINCELGTNGWWPPNSSCACP